MRFQASAVSQMRTALFLIIIQREVIIPYNALGLVACPEMSITNYTYSLYKNSEQCSSYTCI